MRRTIIMRNCGNVYYLGKYVEYMFSAMCRHFKLWDSDTHKYIISIVESKTGEYQFKHSGSRYRLYKGKMFIQEVCKDHFVRIFFRPLVRKRYNITVKKVRIKK